MKQIKNEKLEGDRQASRQAGSSERSTKTQI